MIVKASGDNGETFVECPLEDLFLKWDTDTYQTARAELDKSGHYWLHFEGLDAVLLVRAEGNGGQP